MINRSDIMRSNRFTSPEQRFDATARALHQQALAQLSPQLRHQLKPEQRAADIIGMSRSFGRWHLATALVAIIAVLGMSLAWWHAPIQSASTTPTSAVITSDPSWSTDIDAAVLEQDPDFYAWLAAANPDLIAME